MNFSSNWTIPHETPKLLTFQFPNNKVQHANSTSNRLDVSKDSGTPKWMVKIMENPIKMDDLGGKTPYVWKHPFGVQKFLPLQKGQKGPSLPKSLLPDLFQIRSLTNAMLDVGTGGTPLEDSPWLCILYVCSAYVLKTDCKKKKGYMNVQKLSSVCARNSVS